MSDSSPKPNKKWFETTSESLAWAFGFLSFVADVFTISQIFRGTPDVRPVIPWLGLIIWILAIFTYLALLHYHWERIYVTKSFSETFLGYIAKDLIFYFKEPYRFIPLVLLLALLFPAAYSINSSSLGYISGVIILGVLLLAIAKFSWIMSNLERETDNNEVSGRTRDYIISNWDVWKKELNLSFPQKILLIVGILAI